VTDEHELDEEDATNPGGGRQTPDGRGDPLIRGLIKIDFNDDDAIDAMIKEVTDQYREAAEARGLKFAPKGSLELVSVGGVPAEEYRRNQDAMEAEYRAVLSLQPLGEELGDDGFLQLLDAYIHRELEEEGEAALGQSVAAVLAALEWGDVDLSGIHVEDGSYVWDATAVSLLSFEYREIEDSVPMMGLGIQSTASAAMLDMGRGVTYLCFEWNPDIGIDDYEIFAEVAPDDWDAVRRIAVETMRYAAIFGEPLGKYPDKITVSHPLTMDDVNTAFLDAICSDRSTATEYAEWMEHGGQGVWPVDTTAQRVDLADAYVEIAMSGETG
jgi:hypothetical protein